MKKLILICILAISCTAKKRSTNEASDSTIDVDANQSTVSSPSNDIALNALTLQSLMGIATSSGIEVSFQIIGDSTVIEKIEIRRIIGSTPPADCKAGELVATVTNISSSTTIQSTDSSTSLSTTYSYRICIIGSSPSSPHSTESMVLAAIRTPDPSCYVNPPCGSLSGAASDRTFSQSFTFSDDVDTMYVITSDFNNDGLIDLVFGHDAVTAPENDETPIQVYLNSGSGWTLTDSLGPDGDNDQSNGLGTADYNKDGMLDLAMSTWLGNADDYVFAGNGLGGFGSGSAFETTTNTNRFIYSADLNGDSNIDMVVARDGGMGVYLGNGDLSFAASVEIGVAGNTTRGAIFDFDGDSDLDILRTKFDGDIDLFRNNGNGTFAAALNVVASAGDTQCSAIGDVNDDGNVDIVFTVDNTRSRIALGNGDGTFAASTALTADVATGIYYHACAIADLDGDGHLDIILSEGSLRILWGDGTANPSASSVIWTASSTEAIYDLAIEDLNGDDILDIVGAIGGPSTYKDDRIWFGNAAP